MGRIERIITLNSTPEKIWSIMNDTEKFAKWFDGVKESIASDRIPKVGSTNKMTVVMGDQEIKLDSECVGLVENEKHVWNVTEVHGASGPKKLSFEWDLKPVEAGTQLTFIMDYELPYSILGKILDKVKFSKDMEKSVDRTLQNIKNQVET